MPREWEAYQASVFAVAQITIDLLALAGLVHYSGGVENPFMFFFIFHVIISSILLARRAMFLMTTLAIALAMVIGIGEYLGWLPHYPLNLLTHQGEHLNPAFVFAQLFVLAVTLILAAYMASSIVVHMRSYEREVVFLSDELKAKAEKLESANARMTRVEQTKSQYMRKVAHELKGPLGTIQVVLKVVLDGLVGEISEQARDMIKRAERRAGELAQAVQDLLVLTRAKDGTLVAEMVPVDIAEITADLIVDLREAALQAEVTVNYEPNGSLGRIEAEPTAIRQLVSNLIGNAIRYSRPGGSVQVRLAETDDGLVELEVQDTGIGIPPEDCQRIFEEFFRSGNAKKHAATGTGLGLAIVKAVTDQHGGTVAVESQVGVGTRFTVRLPRQRSAKSAS
jgi:signal transduction histidine kinase